jgi:hypothetical protein
MRHYFFLFWGLLLIGCQHNPMGDTPDWTVASLPTPSEYGGESRLTELPDGDLALSWVEYLNDTTDQLRWARWEGTEWSEPIAIATGSDWFVNWADFPSVTGFANGKSMAAHWLQKSAGGTYDYEVRVSISNDSGLTWGPSFVLHQDSIPAEHGFVTMKPFGSDQLMAVWLDGRFTKREDGAMTLRAATFDTEGNLSGQFELDHRICDCCQTDLVVDGEEAMVVYRDRSEGEIRDISFVRKTADGWTTPQPVHADEWLIAGCPVNGPAVAKNSKGYWASWFTGAGNTAKVFAARMGPEGQSFGDTMRIDFGNPLGRVDVATIEDRVYISWMENGEEGKADICLALVDDGGVVHREKVMTTSGSRSAGFPVLAVLNEQALLLSHTKVNEEGQYVQVEKIDLQ